MCMDKAILLGTDAAFEMVQAYFEKIGMDTSFHSVYEEAKLLTDYYERQKAEEFIGESRTSNRDNGTGGN